MIMTISYDRTGLELRESTNTDKTGKRPTLTGTATHTQHFFQYKRDTYRRPANMYHRCSRRRFHDDWSLSSCSTEHIAHSTRVTLLSPTYSATSHTSEWPPRH